MEYIDFQNFSKMAYDHAVQPRNHRSFEDFDSHARITGPCGDTMAFWLAARNEKVERVSFISNGCRSSLTCGSMVTYLAEGERIKDAAALRQTDIFDALAGLPKKSGHCALLATNTLKTAYQNYLQRQKELSKNSRDLQAACDTGREKNCSTLRRKKDKNEEEYEERRKLQSRLSRIRYKVVVLSGKGGVGKSTVAVNLATSLMMSGKRVGLLDVDIHGPSIPTMLGLEREKIQGGEEGLLPIELGEMKVMSLGFLLQKEDDAVIWRGPMKTGVIKQFLKDVVWGDLDYLIIDSPPGTGDEPLSVCQIIGQLDGAVIVTTPQKVAAVDVRKSITFCRQLKVPVLGVVENMSGFSCPRCGEITQILRSGGGRRIAENMGVPFLGAIPMDPKIAESCDSGQAFIYHYAATPTAEIMRNIVNSIAALEGAKANEETAEIMTNKKNKHIRLAIPLANGKLSMHFGHCERFALLDVDPTEKKILKQEEIKAPPHEPGLLPPWLAEHGATIIIAGGMGQRAQELFTEQGIQVVVGAPAETPEKLASDYFAGTLQVGENICDH